MANSIRKRSEVPVEHTWKVEDLGKAIFYHDRQLNERFLTALT